MDVGVHLPLLDFGGNPFTLDHLSGYAATAVEHGFAALAVNDHLVFGAPWLDGPTALAAVLPSSGTLTLATTVALPVVRGPVPLAKSLAALDRLSGGRLVVAVGPGSSEHDHAAVGLDFAERWARLDEAVVALRTLLRPGSEPAAGRWYSTAGVELLPSPAQPGGATDLDRELGVGCRAATSRAAGRRLAGVGLQHHPRRVRRGTGPARRAPRGERARGRGAAQHAGHDVVPHHRAPRRSRPDLAPTRAARDPPTRGGPP